MASPQSRYQKHRPRSKRPHASDIASCRQSPRPHRHLRRRSYPLLYAGHYAPALSANDMPFGSTTPIGENLQVANLPFTLLQLAARASLTRVIMLATEACGSFTIYQAPQPIKDALQTCVRNRRFPVVGGWEPFIDGNGCLTDLWTRPAPTTAQELSRMTLDAAPKRGCERLRVAASLVKPDAASPFEARAGILLGLPRQHGGEGHAGLSFNKRINLSSKAKTLAHRSFCLCDLYWEEGLDVECQSTLVHNKANSFLSDSDRTTALRNMGIDVLPLTYDQLKSEARFAAFSKTVANIRGKRLKPKTAQIRDAQPGSVGFAAEGGHGSRDPGSVECATPEGMGASDLGDRRAALGHGCVPCMGHECATRPRWVVEAGRCTRFNGYSTMICPVNVGQS